MISVLDDVSLYGYFQTEKYFSSMLILSKKTSDSLMKSMTTVREVMDQMDNPIALHVRRTDYVEKSQDHPPCGMNYKQALKQFPEDQQVIIFSDDVLWCKEQELFKDDRFLVSETDDNLYDLCMMTMCKGYIMSQ